MMNEYRTMFHRLRSIPRRAEREGATDSSLTETGTETESRSTARTHPENESNDRAKRRRQSERSRRAGYAVFALVVLGSSLLTALLTTGCQTTTANRAALDIPTAYAEVAEDPDRKRRLREEAVAYLERMTESNFPGFRVNAIEALAGEPGVGERAARKGLLDSNLAVRFASAMVIGLEEYRDAAPLVHELLQDESESVRIAAIFALAKNGYETNLSALAEYLRSPDLTVRSNAALALGELGEPSAINMLRDALDYTNPRATVTQQRISDLQIAEAMAKLGDDSALSRIRAHLRSTPEEGEVAALAADMLGDLEARMYKRDLVNLVAAWKEYRFPAEVRLAAIGALAQMGDPVPVRLPLEYFGEEFDDQEPNEFLPVRLQATHVLGLIGGDEALPHLADLFYDSDEEALRLQAAAAILDAIPRRERDERDGRSEREDQDEREAST